MALHADDHWIFGVDDSPPRSAVESVETPYGVFTFYSDGSVSPIPVAEMLPEAHPARKRFKTVATVCRWHAQTAEATRLKYAENPHMYWYQFGVAEAAELMPELAALRAADLAILESRKESPVEGYTDYGEPVRAGFAKSKFGTSMDNVPKWEIFPHLVTVVSCDEKTQSVIVKDDDGRTYVMAWANNKARINTPGRKLGVFLKRTPRGGFASQVENKWF